MVDIVKQDMTYLWAISGDVVAPDNTKIQEGWAVEVVPRQWWNWMQYRADSNIAYMLQKGIPEWDSTTEYLANKSFVSAGGIVYKCLITNTGLAPLTNPTQWARAFQDYTAASNALGSLTPAADRLPYFNGTGTAALTTLTSFARTLLDDTTNTAARTTLGAQASHANLTALSGVTAAINTFPYWTSTTAMAAAPITAFARTILDDADAAAVRTTLGLGTAATQNTTTSTTDSTLASLLRIGDWGMSGSVQGVPMPNTNCDDVVYTGVYNIVGATTNAPAGFTSGSTLLHLAWNTGAYHQIAINYVNGTQMAFRRRHSTNGWSAWSYVATTDALQAALAGIGLNVNAAPNLTDLDLVTVTGFNRFTNAALNRPLSGASGTVMTTFYGTTYATQLAITVQTTDATLYNRTFTRTMNQGTWGVWKEQAVTEAPTINNATLTGTTTVPGGNILKVGSTYADLTGSVLYVNNGFNNGTNGITVDSFAPTISFIDRTTNSSGSRWRQDGNILRFDTTADNGATWSTANTFGISSTGNLGVSGALGISTVGVDVGIQSAGNTNISGVTQIGVRSHFNGGADATSAVMGFVAENSVGDNTTTATTTSLIDFQSNTQTINTNHTVTSAFSFRANDKTSTRIQTAYGFYSNMATRAGVNRWSFYSASNAPNYIGGQTIIGGAATLPAANIMLTINGDQNITGTLTSGTITATNVNATNFSVSGAFNPTNITTGDINAANCSVTGNMYAANVVTSAGGVFYSKAANSSSNSHLWFQDFSGNTTGILYASPSGLMTLQAGGAVAATFNPSGGAGFNNITTGNVNAAGGVTVTAGGISNSAGPCISIRSGQSVGASLYSTASFEARAGDGGNAAIGFHRAGINAAALYIGTDSSAYWVDSGGNNYQFVTNGNLMSWYSASSTINAVGSWGMFLLGDGRGALGPGDTIAGASIRYCSTAGTTNGSTGVGTWRIHGFVTNSDGSSSDSVTICIRIA